MRSGITIKELFQCFDVEIKGNRDLEIRGICSHSKLVSPGNLFIAKKGKTFDGTTFISEALAAGAVAILTDLYNPFLDNVVQVIHLDPSSIEPELSNRYFGNPSKELFLIGITGTNGKTTTAYLIDHLLHSKEHPCGLMGTIETKIGNYRVPSELTTADVVTNQKFFREMVDQKVVSGVMEVTSHALDQKRVEGLDFDVALFTNFSQDHLDYHGSMEAYLRAKSRLFKLIDNPLKVAILNCDDTASFQVLGDSKARVITYGIQNRADFQACAISSSLEGTHFLLTYKECKIPMKTSLIGEFNVLNILAALCVGHLRGLSMEEMRRKIENFPGVPGRLERISNQRDIHLFVDFAHTDEALTSVLSVLKKVKKKKIITIFGSGGDRDRQKRCKMGRAVESLSDQMIITSDNPRMEDPREICEQVARGIEEKKKMIIEVDRRLAIERGVRVAEKGDIVLIAGRGPEPFQKIGGRLIPFDDRKVAREVCGLSI